MTEFSPKFTAGTVIELADARELAAFEDAVALELRPKLNLDRWAGRIPLKELIRPPKFNGSIQNIQLTVMDDPFERMDTVRDRGYRLSSRSSITAEKLGHDSIGFTLVAKPKSSRPGSLGIIEAELWYADLKRFVDRPRGSAVRGNYYLIDGTKISYDYTSKSDHMKTWDVGQIGLRRFVTKPRFNQKVLSEYDTAAKKIGIDVIKQAIAHPVQGGMMRPS